MSSFVIHLVVPVLIVLAVRVFAPRDCLLWSWVAVAPDLDYFTWNGQIPGLPNLHRGLLHNLNLLALLIAMTVGAHRWHLLSHPGATVADFLRSRFGAGWVLSCYYYACHMVLDLFAGGIVPLFPFSYDTWFVYFTINVDTATNEPTVDGGQGVSSGIPDVVADFQWLTSEHTAILGLVVASALLARWTRRVLQGRRLRAEHAVPVDETAYTLDAPPTRRGR